MITSAKLQECVVEFLSDGEQRSVQEIKTYLSQSNVNGYTEGQFSGSMNTLQRNGTIKKNERGVYSLRNRDEEELNMKTCFVISPIGEEGTETRKKADQFLKHVVEKTCHECGFNVKRVDKSNDIGSITAEIFKDLEDYDLVIADISEHNPNVFYEIGYRRRTGKHVIHFRRKGEKIPFDIADIRTIEYDLTDPDSLETARNRLKTTVQALTFETAASSVNAPESNIHPILFQILDAINDLRDEVGKNDNNALMRTVIESIQQSKPQMSTQDALLVNLMPMMLEKPDMLQQLIELGEKIPPQQSGKKLRR